MKASVPSRAALWMHGVLLAAALYNQLFAAWAIFFPLHAFKSLGLPLPNYPVLWQCIGMLVGVYGIGYAIAALDPIRYWPLILVGLIGKICGPLGFLYAQATEQLPWNFGLLLLGNDLLWWLPFLLILKSIYRTHLREDEVEIQALQAALHSAKTDTGQDLFERSQQRPQLVVFLRHLGCAFCRQALSDLGAQQTALERHAGLTIVHMGTMEDGVQMRARYGLNHAAFVSDPQRQLYRAFGLRRGALGAVVGPRIWWRGFKALFLEGHRSGQPVGDILQLPGTFLLHHGKILNAAPATTSGDRPDYLDLVAPKE